MEFPISNLLQRREMTPWARRTVQKPGTGLLSGCMTELISEQGWVAGNAATGGWLAGNNDAARAAVERNTALEKAMLSLPARASTVALRAFVGNLSFDEVKQGFSSALLCARGSGELS